MPCRSGFLLPPGRRNRQRMAGFLKSLLKRTLFMTRILTAALFITSVISALALTEAVKQMDGAAASQIARSYYLPRL